MTKTPIRPSILDRAIGFFSPSAMQGRLRSRMQTDIMLRGYESARPSRANAGWRKAGTSADAEIGAAGAMLRDAMRDLVRNNPHAAKAVSSLVSYIVGPGITPRANTGNRALDKRVNKLWDEFTKRADFDDQLDLYGLQTLICREMIEGGEVLIRRRWRRGDDELPVPLQLQILEGDFIDSARDGKLAASDGYFIQGVEFTAQGKRKSYWLWPAHPGNSHMDPRWKVSSKAVAASEIAHVYEKQRTQVRGVPWGVPVMNSLRDLGDYEAAEIMRKKIEACAVGVVSGEEEGPTGAPSDTGPGFYDVDGNLVERFEPGMFLYARGGRQVTFNSPSASGDYEPYKRSMLHTIAAGFRIPYSVLSGDLSQNSYASQKVGMADFARLVESVQWQILIPMACEPIWRWFIEAAFLAGKINRTDIPAKWSPPPFPSGDPAKDIKAEIAAIRAGLKTLTEVAAERGMTIDDLVEEIKLANDKLDAANIVLDTDPRRVTGSGQLQVEPAEESEEPPAQQPG